MGAEGGAEGPARPCEASLFQFVAHGWQREGCVCGLEHVYTRTEHTSAPQVKTFMCFSICARGSRRSQAGCDEGDCAHLHCSHTQCTHMLCTDTHMHARSQAHAFAYTNARCKYMHIHSHTRMHVRAYARIHVRPPLPPSPPHTQPFGFLKNKYKTGSADTPSRSEGRDYVVSHNPSPQGKTTSRFNVVLGDWGMTSYIVISVTR